MRRLRRLVPSGVPRRERQSHLQRVRRMTFLSLTAGLFFAWAGPLAGFGESGGQVRPVLLFVGMPGLAVFSVLYLRMIRAAMAGTSAWGEMFGSAAVVVLLLLTQGGEPWSWGLLAPAWATGVALLLSRSATVLACLAAAGTGLLLVPPGDDPTPVLTVPFVPPSGDSGPAVVAFLLVTVMMPWANRFQFWFWQVMRSAEEGREAQARLAVTEERLRFSRDLHDLVGHSLSAIAVKSEVAAKLSAVDAGRAAAEMDEVRGLARQALKEIRAAVRGYRTVDLAAELRSMTAVLEAAGIRCTLRTPREPVPEEAGALLAWVVREGTTNVLRHSSATRCRIAITLHDGTAAVEMTNNGADAVDGRGGTGLVGLSERVAAAGGVLTAGPASAEEFTLRAAVPLEGVR
ncbi:sensor histidine kinase [Streptosporangium fragile]